MCGVPEEVLPGSVAPEESYVVIGGVAVGVLPGLKHGRVRNRADDVSLLKQTRCQQLLLGVERVRDYVVVAANGKPVEQRRPGPSMDICVHKGLVRRATHLVEDIGDKTVALHARRISAWIAVGPGHVARLLDSLVGGSQIVAVMLVCGELVHNLLPRDAEKVANVSTAVWVVQVPNVFVACGRRLRQGNAV